MKINKKLILSGIFHKITPPAKVPINEPKTSIPCNRLLNTGQVR